jgi:hypothetical protein
MLERDSAAAGLGFRAEVSWAVLIFSMVLTQQLPQAIDGLLPILTTAE